MNLKKSNSDLEAVHRRLEKLEKQNRRMKWFAAGTVIALLGVGFLTGQTTPEKVVEANSFVLKDEAGNVRAALAMVEGSPMLRLFDSAGRPRIVEAVTVIGASIGVLDAAGKPRAALGAALTGEPSVTVFDEDGKPRGVLSAPNGVPGLALFDSARKQRITVALNAAGAPNVTMLDTNGKPRVGMGVAPNGDPLIGVLDEDGKPTVALGRGAYGDGLAIIGPGGKPAAALSVYAKGALNENALTFFDPSGMPRVTIGTTTSAGVPRLMVLDGSSRILWKAP